ncbi:MAG: phage tail tube protein [Bermanella sp.]
MKGRGIKLYTKLTSEDDLSWRRISKVKAYTPGEESVATNESTYIDAEDDYLDHTAGQIDPGEVSFSVEYQPADVGQVLLEASLAKVLDFKVEWQDSSGETYQGTVIKRGMSEPGDEELMRNYALKLKGAPLPFVAP